MRLLCAHFRDIIFESTHHLWMDDDNQDQGREGEDGTELHNNVITTTTTTSARRLRLLLDHFPNLRSLRVVRPQLVYQSLVRGNNGAAASPRYICNLLQEAECAPNLECLEILNVTESQHGSEVWGADAIASSPSSFSQHTDIQLDRLRKLTITMMDVTNNRENPLVHSLLRSSRQITHLTIGGCLYFDDYHMEEAILKPLGNTLTHLTLSCCGIRRPRIESTILETLILEQCANLSTLGPDSFCPSLELLDISSCTGFNGEGLVDVESGLENVCPRLVRLTLHHCSELRHVKIKRMPSPRIIAKIESSGEKSNDMTGDPLLALGRLESVDLSRCTHLESATIISCPLKTVNLGECIHMKMLFLSSPVLEMIDLSHLRQLSLVSLHCPSLFHLNLAWCSDLDSKRSVIKCEALEYVDIRGATYMTPEFFSSSDGRNRLSIRT